MTRQQAKELLLACRFGTSDIKDPEVARALEIAKEDPELRDWFEGHLQFQKQVREILRGTPVPPRLRDQIVSQGKTITPSLWNKREIILAIAAALALLATGIIFLSRPRGADAETFANFQARMTSLALRQYSMDIMTNDQQVVRAHFAAQGTPADFAIPAGLNRIPVKGGKSTTWQNKPVSMLCFDWKDDKILYLFVVEQSALPGAGVTREPKIEQYKSNLWTASWQKDGRVFFLAAPLTRAELEQLIRTGEARAEPPRIFGLHRDPLRSDLCGLAAPEVRLTLWRPCSFLSHEDNWARRAAFGRDFPGDSYGWLPEHLLQSMGEIRRL